MCSRRLTKFFFAQVPVTALLQNVDIYYHTLNAKERAAEFRRSVMSTFFSHLWKLVLSISFSSIVSPDSLDKRERQYSQPSWQQAMFDPLQANSFRMVISGGDIGLKLFDSMIPRYQKRMLKSVRYGTAIMFSHNAQLAGKVFAEQGYRSYGNFITAQAPFLGNMVTAWIQKRQKDRVSEILGWIGLATFFVASVVT